MHRTNDTSIVGVGGRKRVGHLANVIPAKSFTALPSGVGSGVETSWLVPVVPALVRYG